MTFYHPYVDYPDQSSRERLARRLSRVVSTEDITPYNPNEGDHSYWTLDSGNDWKLAFNDLKPHQFEVHYRYENRFPKEAALGEWLMVRFGLDIIK